MALSAALEELLKTLPADVQAQQRAILEKHPSLGEGWLRQSDYDRFMNANKEKIESVDRVTAWHAEWKPKYDKLAHEHNEQTARISQLEADKQKLEADLQAASVAAVAARGADGNVLDAAKIAAAVKQVMGDTMLTKAEIATLVAAETAKQTKEQFETARKNFYEHDFTQSAAWITEMNDVQWKWREEFPSKPFDKAAFAKFMTEEKITSPIAAYVKYTEKDRTEAEVNRRVTEKLAEERKSNPPAAGVPGSSGAPGHLQIRLTERKPDDPLFGKDFELGDNSAATAAAAEWRGELASRG